MKITACLRMQSKKKIHKDVIVGSAVMNDFIDEQALLCCEKFSKVFEMRLKERNRTFFERAPFLSDEIRIQMIGINEKGKLFVLNNVVIDYFCKYAPSNEETWNLIKKARNIFEELKKIDHELYSCSISSNRVHVLGDYKDPYALIQIKGEEFATLNLMVFEELNGAKADDFPYSRENVWFIEEIVTKNKI